MKSYLWMKIGGNKSMGHKNWDHIKFRRTVHDNLTMNFTLPKINRDILIYLNSNDFIVTKNFGIYTEIQMMANGAINDLNK